MGREQSSSGDGARRDEPPRPLLPGKLATPEVTCDAVARPPLEAFVDAGIDAGIVIVCAPAGTGKTHLLAEWSRRQRTPRDVAWVTLDPADRDPSRFLRYVIAAIAGTPAGREAVAGLGAPPPLTRPDEGYLGAVADAMGRLSGDVVLVLDSFENVVGSETEELLERILSYPPARVRPAIASRVEPRLGQPRLRLTGHLAEIDADALALATSETRGLLLAHGISLDDASVELLHQRTQGWVAAVCFVAASLRQTRDVAAYLAALPHGDTALSSYLLTEVYDRQTSELQQALLRTCVVDALCPGLAEELTGHVGDALVGLQRQRLLVPAPELGGSWCRWNPLFLDLLRTRLHDDDPELEHHLHRRAAAWLRREGLLVEAIRQALAGEDVDAAAMDLAGCWLGLFTSGESAVLRDLLDLFPEVAVARHPDVAVAAAFTAVRLDDVGVALALVAQALEGASDLSASRRHAVATMASVVRLYAATLTGRAEDERLGAAALALLDQAPDGVVAVTRESRTRRALLLYNLGAFETSRQQYDAAGPHLGAALVEAGLLGLPYLELSCAAQLLEHDLVAGRLNAANARGGEILTAARERGWGSYHGLTTAHIILAAVALLRDDLTAALDHAAEAERIARPIDHLNRSRISLLRAVALCGTGRPRDAELELDRLRRRAGTWELPAWVATMVEVVAAWLEACHGDPGSGLRRLEAAGIEIGGSLPFDALTADLLLCAGRAGECHDLLDPWIKKEGRGPVALLARVVVALADEELGRHGDALDGLDSVLGVAASEGLVTPMLVPGPRVRPLLDDLIQRGTPHEAAALEVLVHMAGHAGDGPTMADAPYYVEPLSERELEVLQLLQGTGTNQEVATRLFISTNTLRSHMKSINRKLAATSRRDAVRRARELRIL